MTATKQHPDLDTLKGRLAAALKDHLMIVPGTRLTYADEETNHLIHEAKVTPTDPSNLTPYEVRIVEHITADGSHCTIACTCEGGATWGRACKHAALVMDDAGLLHEGWHYRVLDGEEAKHGQHASREG